MIRNEALVTVTGWLNDRKDFSWGVALKVSVDVRKKNEANEWETTDKTAYDVNVDETPNLDGVKQVTVVGRIVSTATFDKRDGSTGAAIRVRATSVVPVVDEGAPNVDSWAGQEKVGPAAVKEQWPGATVGQANPGTPF